MEKTKFRTRCVHLIKDGESYLCDATECDCVKNCIRFCPENCAFYITKKESNTSTDSVEEEEDYGSL